MREKDGPLSGRGRGGGALDRNREDPIKKKGPDGRGEGVRKVSLPPGLPLLFPRQAVLRNDEEIWKT